MIAFDFLRNNHQLDGEKRLNDKKTGSTTRFKYVALTQKHMTQITLLDFACQENEFGDCIVEQSKTAIAFG